MAKKEGSKVPDTQENMKLCICGGCPTFKKSPLSGGFFCAKGKARKPLSNLAAPVVRVLSSRNTA